MRPFKPLTLRKPDSATETAGPPAKRRRLSPPDDELPEGSVPTAAKHAPIRPREPLRPLANPPSSPTSDEKTSSSIASHFTVLWRNPTGKKNKTWTGDGVLSVSNGFATFCDSSGKTLGRCAFSRPLLPGSNLTMSGKEIEIDSSISRAEFLAILQPRAKPPAKPTPSAPVGTGSKTFLPEPAQKKGGSLQSQMKAAIKKEKDAKSKSAQDTELAAPLQPLQSAYKPLVNASIDRPQMQTDTPKPRYDPAAPGAVLFKRLKKASPGQQIVDVVLDPALGKRLHEHQREGVKFLYECVNGLRDFNGQGCILADDMGLGKTVQTIALLWTLIKQSPIHKLLPTVKKALIVCPVSVIQNWKKEFRKWLPHTNIGVLVFEDPKTTRLRMFDGKVYNIMIIGYERLRMVADELADSHDIDIVICDEGHRLKTEKNKSAKAIQALNTPRRIILSGTPIQNDLSEFFSMVNFVNDGCLGSAKAFAKDFENPIMRSRQPHATHEAIERGEEAAEELARTTAPFILRRTADVLSDILPTKTEYVLFCKPTAEQADVYRNVVGSPMFRSAMGSMGGTESALQLITILKKLCNSPALLKSDTTSDQTISSSLKTLNEALAPSVSRHYRNDLSAKIRLLDVLLQQIRQTTDEKVVLVSNYTSTLNLMANLLDNSGLKYLRLDGTVVSSKRQGLVDQFNRSPPSNSFAFLLSAKAGGVGINLIGASRLVLFDVDWNPATDDQAIARVHRQGQMRPTHIYRFLLKGCIEERIWQRQVVKRGLADSIMEGRSNGDEGSKGSKGKGGAAFSQEELRDLFRYDGSEGLRTHDLIGCGCGGKGGMAIEDDASTPKEDSFWEEHSESPERDQTPDLPDFKDIVPASQLETEEDGTVSPRKGSPHKNGRTKEIDSEELMKYLHIDTSKVPLLGEDSEELEQMHLAIDDPCLTYVLYQDEDTVASSVAYVFKRVWGSKSIDEENQELVVKQEDVKPGLFA